MYCLEYRYFGKNKEDANEQGLLSTQNSKIIEMMSEEEKKKKAFIITDDGKVKFGIPDNVYIIGMMNDVDRSIDAFDLALRRRFKWKRMDCDYTVLKDTLNYENLNDYVAACERLNNYIVHDLNLGKSYEFGHSFFLKMLSVKNNNETGKIANTNMTKLFDDYLESTLREYLRANFSESELDDKLKIAKEKFNIPKQAK